MPAASSSICQRCWSGNRPGCLTPHAPRLRMLSRQYHPSKIAFSERKGPRAPL